MPLPQNNPESLSSWEALKAKAQTLKSANLLDLFDQHPKRVEQMSLEWNDFYVDFSKNLIDDSAWKLLYQLASETGLEQAKKAYFEGSTINVTEGRAVLHTALRGDTVKAQVDGKEVSVEVAEVLGRVKALSNAVLSGQKTGYTQKKFTDVVNIGIGGSDLGPVMVTEALAHYKNHLNLHFMSNVDPDHSAELLSRLNPETTLFLIVSKSFGTQETLMNAQTVRKWFI